MIELIPLIFIVFYFVPFMVAAGRNHSSTVTILIVNFALGWTVVGWWLVLGWALLSPANANRAVLPSVSGGHTGVAKPRILHRF
jgi:hypothetical protein